MDIAERSSTKSITIFACNGGDAAGLVIGVKILKIGIKRGTLYVNLRAVSNESHSSFCFLHGHTICTLGRVSS